MLSYEVYIFYLNFENDEFCNRDNERFGYI